MICIPTLVLSRYVSNKPGLTDTSPGGLNEIIAEFCRGKRCVNPAQWQISYGGPRGHTHKEFRLEIL